MCSPGAGSGWPCPREAAFEEALAQRAPDSHGLTALPFLAGERSPGWRDDARAAITGLSLATNAVDLAAAMLEAVALRLSLVYERLAPLADAGHEVIASGGALLRSPAWTRMLADAFGRPLTLSAGGRGLEPRRRPPDSGRIGGAAPAAGLERPRHRPGSRTACGVPGGPRAPAAPLRQRCGASPLLREWAPPEIW